MSRWVAIVLDVTGLKSVDGMIAPHADVRPRKPERASLTEDDIAGDDILLCVQLASLLAFTDLEPFIRCGYMYRLERSMIKAME